MNSGPVLRFLRRVTGGGSGDTTDGVLLARFVAGRDEAAFAELVRRHGPMVHGVCLRVLGDAHDADDAFQATFLVLTHKARGVARPELLGNWLYGVAHRTARRARADSARRRQREAGAAPPAGPPDPADEAARDDLRRVLDDEVSRLPEKYRAPLVLCFLEGKTQDEAARWLGCPRKTLTTRLARAAERLRGRLARRGIALSAGALAAALAPGKVSAALAETTVRAASGHAAVPPAVASLTKGVLRAMFAKRLTAAAASLAAVLLVAVCAFVWAYRAPAAPETDRDKLQGTWTAVAAELYGRKVTEQELKDMGFRLIFKGDAVTLAAGGKPEEGTFRIDPDQKPRHIDLRAEGKTILGIYAFDGDTLRLCFAAPGADRPKEFASSKEAKTNLAEFRKQKE